MHEEDRGNLLVVQVSDKLTNSDFEKLAPEFQRLVQQRGKVRVLYELNDFHGWDAKALWDEIKFDFKNFADVERIAVVGDVKWEHCVEELWKPFTLAKVQYFHRIDSSKARTWLRESS
jgi:hypothetical protein